MCWRLYTDCACALRGTRERERLNAACLSLCSTNGARLITAGIPGRSMRAEEESSPVCRDAEIQTSCLDCKQPDISQQLSLTLAGPAATDRANVIRAAAILAWRVGVREEAARAADGGMLR